MADSSSDSIGSFTAEKIEQQTRDVFQGNALIDRLLVYFSKFEGSREKARKYAQKLLDLGHIESLERSAYFEDSLREYRWTDVASVVNKAKARAQENDSKPSNGLPVASQSLPQVSGGAAKKEGRPTLRISIEADNCDGAEIEAHIRTNPNPGSVNKGVRSSTKSGDTICLAEVQNGKMISFTTETSKTAEVLRLVPVSAMSQKREFIQSKIVPEEQEKEFLASNERKRDSITKKRDGPQSISDVDSAVEVDKTSTQESPLIVKQSTPGKGGASQMPLTLLENHSHELVNFSMTRNTPNGNTGSKEKFKQGMHKYKWNDTNTYALKEANSSSLSNGSRSECTSVTESDRSTPEQSRKLKFKDDSDWIKMRREYIDSEEIRQATERSYGHIQLFDDPGISLHSAGYQETIQEVSEPEDEPQTVSECNKTRQEKDYLAPPLQPAISISPPPSTPGSPERKDLGVKSLFWTKIKCDTKSPEEIEGVFWLNVEKKIQFDEAEFSKIFSKPFPSPLRKSSRTSVKKENSDSKNLKVLGTERSRQVGIRASSIHLQTEEIHDAIVNMDDSALSLDALEALFDIRPTSDELDDIADALKRNPNAILDKPEQFVLMLAMLNNLDERLKCWIFVKRFPDKVLDLKDQLNTVSNVCIQVVRNSTLQLLLEATLVFGNFMNKGTQRGDADGYLLDILPKLKDVKSQAGDTNLMLYLVRWVAEGRKKKTASNDIARTRDSTSYALNGEEEEDDCGLPSQSSLQKAYATSMQDLLDDIDNLVADLNECKDQLMPAVIEGATCLPEIKPFNDRMHDFIEQADKAMVDLQSLAKETSEIAEEFKRYYIPVDAKSESLINMLKHISMFCDDFRFYWDEEKRNVAKDAFFNTEKARRQRIAAVKIAKSPSALKARFLEKRRRERATINEKKSIENCHLSQPGGVAQHPTRFHSRSNGETDNREANNGRLPTPLRPHPISRPKQHFSGVHSQTNGRIGNTHISAEKQITASERNIVPTNTPAGMSRMKQAMMKRRLLLKSKTC